MLMPVEKRLYPAAGRRAASARDDVKARRRVMRVAGDWRKEQRDGMRFIDHFDVILLDVQKTFMFGVDRFEEDEDFFATYQAVGGEELSRSAVCSAILSCLEYLGARYEDPAYYDAFPTLRTALEAANPDLGLSQTEIGLLQTTFASHECGTVSDEHARTLKELAKTHRLGVVSNIWAEKHVWIREFRRMGILDLFEVLVFSSDYPSIKPSPVLFQEAASAFDAPLERMVFVGDSLAYDIAGAKAAGLRSILTTNGASIEREFTPKPDHVVPDLHHLLLRQGE